jgi:mannosyltransferase
MERQPLISRPWQIALTLSGGMVVAALLSFWLLNPQSLRLDEAQSLWQTARTPAGIFRIVAQDVHVPLYHLLLHYWQAFLGTSIAAARILSLIFYLLTIPAVYVLGRLIYSEKVSLFAALLVSCSPFLAWYGSEARMYSMLTLIAVINQYAFLKIYREEGKQWPWWYFVTGFLGMYTHYLFFAQFATQALFLLLKRRQLSKGTGWRFVCIYASLSVLFLPWLIYVVRLGAADGTRPLLTTPTVTNLFNTLAEFFVGFQSNPLNTAVVSLWPLTILFGFFALQRNQRMSEETQYFFLSFVVPIVLVFVFSIFIRPFYLSRYLIFVIPAFYLVISWLFSTYGKKAGLLRVGLLVLMVAALSGQALSVKTPVREDYRAASDYFTQHVSAMDTVAISAPFTIYPIEYYYHGPARLQTLPLWDRTQGPPPQFNQAELPGMVRTIAGDHEHVCLLLSYDQGYENSIRTYFDTHFQLTDVKQFSDDLSARCYQVRYDI